MSGCEMKAFIEEQLAPLGPVTAKRMFSGGGVFLDGLMLGLIIEDALYLKADDVNRPAFEAEGQEPFAYARTGSRTTVMSYWRAPDRLFDEPDELVAWASEAFAAALRAKKPARARRATAKERGS
jgi:DNA transformation protein